MDDDPDDQNIYIRQNYLRPKGIFSPLVVDYYNRHGRGRDLEQYFSLMTASPEPEVAPAVFNSLQEETNYITSRPSMNEQPTITLTEIAGKSEVQNDNKESGEKETEVNLIDLSSDYDSSPRKLNASKNDNIHNDTKNNSPTGSMSSHRKLEWDSLADVGYDNENSAGHFLSSIEKIALKHRLKGHQNNSKPVPCSSHDSLIIQHIDTINVGKPSAQSTPLTTAENSPVYPTIINKKKSILKISPQKSRPSNSKTPTKSQHRNKSKEKLIKEEVITLLNTQKAKQPSNVSVTLTRNYNLNLGLCKKDEVGGINNQKHDNLKQTVGSSVVEEDHNSPEFKSQVPVSMTSKEIQTSTREHASTSVQTSILPDDERNIPKFKESVIYFPTTSRHILSHTPVIVNIKSPRDFTFKLPKRKPVRLLKYTKDSKSKEILKSTGKSQHCQQTSTSKQEKTKPSEGLLSRADSFEYMPGHMYQVDRSQENLPQKIVDSSSKFTNSNSSQHISSSSNYSIKPQREEVSTMRKDLEKSVLLLNKILQTYHKDAALKKQLVRNVVKKLLKTHYSDDDTSTDFLSRRSYHSSKISLHNETSSRSTTSDSYLSNQYLSKYPKSDKHLKQSPSKDLKIYDYKKFFGGDSTSSQNESSNKSNIRISFQEWMKPKTKSEKVYMLQKEENRLQNYLEMKNCLIGRKMSDSKRDSQSSKPISVVQINQSLESDQANPVLVNEQIQVGSATEDNYHSSSLRKEIKQLNYLHNEIRNIYSDTSSFIDVSQIKTLLNDILKTSSVIAKHRAPGIKTSQDKRRTTKICSSFILSDKSPENQSAIEVPPLNFKKGSSEDSSISVEFSSGSKEVTDKIDPTLASNDVKSDIPILQQDAPCSTKMTNLECVDGDIIDNIFLESLQNQEKKIQDSTKRSSSLLNTCETTNLRNLIEKSSVKPNSNDTRPGGVLKSYTIPITNRRSDRPLQRNAFTLDNINQIPKNKINLNLKILNQKYPVEVTPKDTLRINPTKRSQEIQTEVGAEKNERSTNTDTLETVAGQSSKQVYIGNNQISVDSLSELISCLHKTLVQLKLSGLSKNIDSVDSDTNKTSDSKIRPDSSKEKLKIKSESSRKKVNPLNGTGDMDKGSARNNYSGIETEAQCKVSSDYSSYVKDHQSTTGTTQKASSKKVSKNDIEMISSSSLDLNEETYHDLIKDIVKHYKQKFGKTYPTEEFAAKLMGIFTTEYEKFKKGSTECKRHPKMKKISRHNPDCKSKHHSQQTLESDQIESQPNYKQICKRCNRYKVQTDSKSAFSLCPQYKIPKMICPCHCEKYKNFYSQLLENKQIHNVPDSGDMFCLCHTNHDSHKTGKTSKHSEFPVESHEKHYPKPVAYNLIVEPTSALKKQNRRPKKKTLPDVVVRVPKFGEWFDYYENDKMQNESNKENQYKSKHDKSVLKEAHHKHKSRNGLSEDNNKSSTKRNKSLHYSDHQETESSCRCDSCTSEKDLSQRENEKEIDSNTFSKKHDHKGERLENETSTTSNRYNETSDSSVVSSQLTLRDYLAKNRANFIKAAERRRSIIKSNGEDRKNVANEALFYTGPSDFNKHDFVVNGKYPLYSEKEIKNHTLKVIRNLPEKRLENERIKKITKQKINSIRSQIFNKKLQRKTLGGDVNIPIRSVVMAS